MPRKDQRGFARSGATVVPSSDPGIGDKYWVPDAVRKMDARFQQAMLDALPAGSEYCATAVSTVACTRFPIPNYQRPE
jgi:hypothetical protein